MRPRLLAAIDEKSLSKERLNNTGTAQTGAIFCHIRGSTNCEIWRKIDDAMREQKLYIQTLKTLHLNCENVISKL